MMSNACLYPAAHMDKDGNGRISASEVSTALGETGLTVTPRSLEGLIAEDLQLPGCKSLGFNEFKVRDLALGDVVMTHQ